MAYLGGLYKKYASGQAESVSIVKDLRARASAGDFIASCMWDGLVGIAAAAGASIGGKYSDYQTTTWHGPGVEITRGPDTGIDTLPGQIDIFPRYAEGTTSRTKIEDDVLHRFDPYGLYEGREDRLWHTSQDWSPPPPPDLTPPQPPQKGKIEDGYYPTPEPLNPWPKPYPGGSSVYSPSIHQGFTHESPFVKYDSRGLYPQATSIEAEGHAAREIAKAATSTTAQATSQETVSQVQAQNIAAASTSQTAQAVDTMSVTQQPHYISAASRAHRVRGVTPRRDDMLTTKTRAQLYALERQVAARMPSALQLVADMQMLATEGGPDGDEANEMLQFLRWLQQGSPRAQI